jgi:hypothetical protein
MIDSPVSILAFDDQPQNLTKIHMLLSMILTILFPYSPCPKITGQKEL